MPRKRVTPSGSSKPATPTKPKPEVYAPQTRPWYATTASPPKPILPPRVKDSADLAITRAAEALAALDSTIEALDGAAKVHSRAANALDGLKAELQAAKQRIEDLEKEVRELTADNRKLEEQLEDLENDVASAAERVLNLAPHALGHEDAVAEPIPMFNFRRALEDLRTEL